MHGLHARLSLPATPKAVRGGRDPKAELCMETPPQAPHSPYWDGTVPHPTPPNPSQPLPILRISHFISSLRFSHLLVAEGSPCPSVTATPAQDAAPFPAASPRPPHISDTQREPGRRESV